MERRRPCPVCGNWRWRREEVPDADGHHPDCGVNLRRQERAGAEREAREGGRRRAGKGREPGG